MGIINPRTGREFKDEDTNGRNLPKVIVGILAGGSIVDSAFAETFPGALIGHGELFWAEQCWVHGGIPDDSRNQIIKTGLERDFDYVFFMDSDMVFPKAALAQLLMNQTEIIDNWPEHRNTPTVMGGIYNTRSDHRLNVYDWREDLNSFMVKPVQPHSGVHKCDFVATGCQLIDLGLFEGLEYPYFEYWYRPFGKDGTISKWSEDAAFGKKCHDIGVPHFANSNVICKHIHSCLITPISAEEYQIEKLSGEIYEDVIEGKEHSTGNASENKEKVSES